MNATSHPSDEALSTLLDERRPAGEPGAVAEHLRTCDACSARLESLRSARELLGAGDPAPLDEVTRRRLVGRALDAAVGSSARTPAPLGRPATPPWWRGRLALVVAAAAVVIVVVGSLALFNGGGQSNEAATAKPEFGAQARFSSDTYAGDIGSLEGQSTLVEALSQRGIETQAAASAPQGSGVERGIAGGSAGSANAPAGSTSDQSSTAPNGQTGSTTRAAAQAVAPSPQSEPHRAAAGGQVSTDAVERCVAAEGKPENSELALTATGTFNGQPAIALVFRFSDQRFLGVIVSADSCSILSVQDFR